MTKNDQELTSEELRLIQILISNGSYEEAAKELHISLRTAQRWAQRPHVAAALQQAKQNIAETVREQIKALSSKAIQALSESLDLPDTPAVRLKATQIVLDRIAPTSEQAEQQIIVEGAIPKELTFFMTEDEIDQVDHLVAVLSARKRKAEDDKAALERKRM